MARRRLRGQGKAVGRGGHGPERGGRAQTTQARTGGGRQSLGAGMGQGGPKDRLAEPYAAARIRGLASSMGGGADLLVDRSKQEDEQGLREAVRQRGGDRLRRTMIRLMARRLARG